MEVERLAASRSPCSVAEHEATRQAAAALVGSRLEARVEPFRAPTSPTWAPLVRALLRFWTAALVATGWPDPAIAVAVVGVFLSAPSFAVLLRHLPGLGGTSQNAIARVGGSDEDQPPLVVVAHVDTHPTNGAPLRRAHATLAALSTWLALAIAVGARFGAWAGWRTLAAVVALEAIVTLVWLARGELGSSEPAPDDNASGLLALTRTGALLQDGAPVRETWLVATGAATAGGHGVAAFLRSHPDVARRAWVVELDALGAGELVLCPARRRLPQRVTPGAVVRAVAGAAIDTGDPIDVRRVRRPHSDARTALWLGAAAITLTGGLRPTDGSEGPDPANAERAARIVVHLARTGI